jgi:hypothetical protein
LKASVFFKKFSQSCLYPVMPNLHNFRSTWSIVFGLNVIWSQAHNVEDECNWAVYFIFLSLLVDILLLCYFFLSWCACLCFSWGWTFFCIILFVKDPSDVFRFDIYLRNMEMFLKSLWSGIRKLVNSKVSQKYFFLWCQYTSVFCFQVLRVLEATRLHHLSVRFGGCWFLFHVLPFCLSPLA